MYIIPSLKPSWNRHPAFQDHVIIGAAAPRRLVIQFPQKPYHKPEDQNPDADSPPVQARIVNQQNPTTQCFGQKDIELILNAAEGLTVADLLSRSNQILFSLGNGYYWNDTFQCVMEDPDYPREEKDIRYYNHKERRALAKAAQKAIQSFRVKEEPDQTCIDFCNAVNTLERARTAPDAGAVTVDTQETELARNKIKAILESREPGCNFLLKAILCQIHNIVNDMETDKDLRERFFTNSHAFTRDRKITLADLLLFLLTMAGMNMNKEVYDFFKLDDSMPSVPAMVERRALLKPEGVEYFCAEITRFCETLLQCVKRQSEGLADKFSAILACDGSDINVFLDPTNAETFIQQKKRGQNNSSNADTQSDTDSSENITGYNQYHLNAMADYVTGMILASVLQGKAQVYETKAAVEMIRDMEFTGRTLFEGDRGYNSLNLIETVRRKKNCECLIRVREDWIYEIEQLPYEELDMIMKLHITTRQTKMNAEARRNHEVKYLSGHSPKPGKNKKCVQWDYEDDVEMEFRVVRFKLDSGKWETLVTTLDKEEFSLEDLKTLYFLRWKTVENGFRVLKWDNHLAQMHCKRDDFSRQEIHARIAMFNIVSCVSKVAAAMENAVNDSESNTEEHEVRNRNSSTQNTSGRKAKSDWNRNLKNYPTVINRRYATMIVCDWFKHPDSVQHDIIQLMLKNKTPVRSGRTFKRDMKAIGFAGFLYR